MTIQAKPSNVWLEHGSVDSLPVPVHLQKDGSGDWILSTSGEKEGAFVDYRGTGDYDLLDLTDEQLLVADGADYTLSSTGPAIAFLEDDGAGNPAITTDLTDPIIARFVHNIGADVVLYRDASPELQMLQIGSDVLCYQDN